MTVGKPVSFEGHTLIFRGVRTVNAPGRSSLVATVDLDGHAYYPAVEEFALSNDAVPSPAVRSTPVEDVYMTLASTPAAGKSPAAIGVIVEPLVLWLWIGGLVIIMGAALSLWPSRHRRGGAEERGLERAALVEESIELPGDVAVDLAGKEIGAPV